jgi:hypothetical protein
MSDFIHGMLTSEIYEEKIHSYILKNNEVAIRTNDAVGVYDAYCSLISRYLYPYTIQASPAAGPGGPSRAAKGGKQQQNEIFTKYMDYNKYIKSKHSLQSVKLSHGIYIGENSTVGGGSSIFKSIICRNASIGSNCCLKYCVVLDGSQLPDNSSYEHCLLEMFEGKLSVTSFKNDVCREM